MGVKVKFIEVVGYRVSVVLMIKGCKESWTYHRAEIELDKHMGVAPEKNSLISENYNYDDYRGNEYTCQHCGEKFISADVSFSQNRLYNTESGNIEVGCMFWNDWFPNDFYWDNQTEPHLTVRLPNGHDWNIDSRASNCTMQEDRTHRCWVRHGIPPNITVDKTGHTCQAGGGSIQMGDWHGFLRNGELVQ